MIQDSLMTRPLAIGQVLMSLGFLMVGISQKPGVRADLWPKLIALAGLCLIVSALVLVKKNPRFSFVAFSVIGFSLVYMSSWIHGHVLPSVDRVWRHAVVALYVVGMAVLFLSVIKTASKLYSLARNENGSLT